MLSNISIPLLGIVDTAILGHLQEPHYLGAVSVGASIMAMVLWTFSFLRTSTTGLTAQHHGANEQNLLYLVLLRAMLLSLLLSVLLFAFRTPLLNAALAFVDASDTVDALALDYGLIRFYSLPALLLTYCLTGWLIGTQRTRAVMLIIITTNLVNIVLDVIFIVYLDLNSTGAAWATVIAEYSGCAIGLWIFVRHQLGRPASARAIQVSALLEPTALIKLIQMNVDLMVRTFSLLFCFLFFTAKGAQQSDTILAANAILLQLVLLSAFALDGFAHAAESLCGFAIGKRRLSEFYDTVKACLHACLLTSALLTLLLLVLQQTIVFNYSSIVEVQVLLQQYYVWLLLLPVAAVWCYLLDGVFIGASKTAAMRNSMLACTLLVFLPLWYLTQGMGNHGLWLAFISFNLFRGVSLGAYYWYYSKHDMWL